MSPDPVGLFTSSINRFFPLFLFAVSSLVEGLAIKQRLKVPLSPSFYVSIVMNAISLIPAIPITFLPSAQLYVGINLHWEFTPMAFLMFSSVIMACYLISLLIESMVLQRMMNLDGATSRRTSFYANTIGYAIMIILIVFFPRLFLVLRSI